MTTRPVPDNVDTHKVDTEGLRPRETETDSESTRPDETNQMPGTDDHNRMSREKNITLHLGMPSVLCNYPDPFYFRQFFPFFFIFFPTFNFHLSFQAKANTSKAKAIKGTSKSTFSTGELPSWRPMAKSRKASREIAPCLATDFHFSSKQTSNFFLSTKITCRCRK